MVGLPRTEFSNRVSICWLTFRFGVASIEETSDNEMNVDMDGASGESTNSMTSFQMSSNLLIKCRFPSFFRLFRLHRYGAIDSAESAKRRK